jgi:CHAT domain-containing protein
MTTALQEGHPVVHIASHFHFHPGNNTASFLLLGDGTHLSLAELHKKPALFHGVDLLTLSACNTAMGDLGATGQEIDGFARQAQQQGAKAVVASLWPVADASTKDLMQTLYRLRASQPGLPKVEALRQAQLALPQTQGVCHDGPVPLRFRTSARAPYAHPFYWAPFILIGNWK